MKIYFSGGHAVGKSTLVKYTAEKYKLPIIPETARMVLSDKELQIDALRSNMDLVDEYQTEVFNRQLLEEAKYKGFVSDRCLLDILAYSGQHSRILPELLKSPKLPTYINLLRDKSSIVFFVRPSKATLKNDGIRENVSWDGVIAIDAQLKLLFELYSIRYFQINVDNMQERIGAINSVLSLIC